MAETSKSVLSLLGGPKSVESGPAELFDWPIVNDEMEQAVLTCLRRRAMSSFDETVRFEDDYAHWLGVKYALAHNTGTASLLAAMYGAGVGVGDEVISSSLTYWATCLQALSLGATAVFADVDPERLTIDPNDIEHRITPRTKAIIVVHYAGMPADMDPILAIAAKHNLKVIEDCSHAHGSLYKGRLCGTLGHVAGLSLMTGKSFAIGEGGMLTTNDQLIYERAILFGHYERHNTLELPETRRYAGLPSGGFKHRMHQMSSYVGRVQIKKYPQEMAEIDRAMNAFCDRLAEIPGFVPHRPKKEWNCSKGGWYLPMTFYDAKAFGGLSIQRMAAALTAEGVGTSAGCNTPLHLHPIFSEEDVYGHGCPTAAAHRPKDAPFVPQGVGSLPKSETIFGRCLTIPWFKKYRPDVIDTYISAYRKVADNYRDLLADDELAPLAPAWSTFLRKK